jgi:hypothetical protein
MKLLTFINAAPIGVLLALAACNSQPETIDPNADPDANELASAPPVELPPMVTASRSYRCKDNSLAYVDFFNNNTAVYKKDKAEPAGTQLKSEGEGKPYVAEGYSVSGSGNEVTITAPGKGTQSCKA